jgi:myosin heavy subunit
LGRTSDLDVSLHLPSLQDIHERILHEYIDARTQMDRLEEEEPEAVRLLVTEEELRAKWQRKAAKIAKDRETLKRERKQYDVARGELAELERRSSQAVLAAVVAASKKAAADRRVELDKRLRHLDKDEDNLQEREEAEAELEVMVRAARRKLEIATDDKLVRRVAVLRKRLEESDVKQMDEKKIIQEIAKCFRSAKVMVTTVIQRCRVPIVKVKVLALLTWTATSARHKTRA